MSRSGYSDDMDDVLTLGRWRAQVASTIRGKNGQAFLREMIASLDAMPDKRLVSSDLQRFRYTPVGAVSEGVCAIGSIGRRRGVDMGALDPEDPDGIAAAFGITHQLVREIEYMNDEAFYGLGDDDRWRFMRDWALSQLISPETALK